MVQDPIRITDLLYRLTSYSPFDSPLPNQPVQESISEGTILSVNLNRQFL